MKVHKVEHHSVNWHYYAEIDLDKLREIYPDEDDEVIAGILADLENGNRDIETVLEDAWENNIDIEWEFDYDDVWTDRKGGYDITYEIEGDE